MPQYNPPVSDLLFLFSEVFAEDIRALGCDAELGPDTVSGIAENFGAFANDHLLPLNQAADRAGCRLIDGRVIVPDGYASLWQRFCADGWNGLPLPREWDGQGLPNVMHYVVREALASTGIAFSLYHELSYGVCKLILTHGPDWMRRLAVPNLVCGRWSGTMNLTEPHCGSDLGLIRTRASPRADGTYRINGEKIFITCGDHDLAENILHLVLARIEGVPAGVGGISLFMVPKTTFPAEATGRTARPGTPNGVSVLKLERKMGLHASPTCALHYEDAIGWIIGQENRGLSQMFTMMNAARLGVGIQSVGLSEMALQLAEAYATQRLQGRAVGSQAPPGTPEPIIVHPDIRRELLTMRARVESGRAWGWWLALELDSLERHPARARREKAQATLDLLTPIFKAALSEQGFDVANRALMVHGGHGYIEEMGVEQLVRDGRIGAIYEGTNGIQARDLVLRKLPADGGAPVRVLLDDIETFLAQQRLPRIDTPMSTAVRRLRQTTQWILEHADSDPEWVLGGSQDYLGQFALVLQGYLWARMARAAHLRQRPVYRRKVQLAEFFIERILPRAEAFASAALSSRVPQVG